MKLKNTFKKISSIFTMLIFTLTVFTMVNYTCVKYVKADETTTEGSTISDNNYLSSLVSSNGTLSPLFDKDINDYQLTIDKYDYSFTLTAVAEEDVTIVEGLGTYQLEVGETKNIDITVTSESGLVNIYAITATREGLAEGEHSSKLSKLEIEDYEGKLNPGFYSLTTEYNLDIANGEIDLNVVAETFDKEAIVKIENDKYIKNDTGVITITVIEPNSENTVYTINYTKTDVEIETANFEYTGSYQTFTTTYAGRYKIELWGAQGNNVSTLRSSGGKGAYTSGIIDLKSNQTLYVYVGEHRTDRTASFNAGSTGGSSSNTTNGGSTNGYGGGGATDIRLVSGDWNLSTGLNSRIMVAAGGGGASNYAYPADGGYGGALVGGSGNNGKYPDIGVENTPPTGGTQTTGGTTSVITASGGTGSSGTFGVGGNSHSQWGSAGGGGYYGGAGAGYSDYSVDSGAGGSSYISGYAGAIAITSESDTTAKDGCEEGTTDITCSYHYSNMIFEKTVMLAGNEEMPTQDGTTTMVGNEGNGYAKITSLFIPSEDNYLTSLTSSSGTLSPTFDPLVTEYTLLIDEYTEYFTIDGELSDENSVVYGFKKYSIKNGESKTLKIVVTSQSGEMKFYSIYVTRDEASEAVNTSLLKTLKIGNYEDSISPQFTPLVTEYNLQINANDTALTVDTVAYNSNAVITVTGNDNLSDEGVITVEVAVEGLETTTYTVNYTKVSYIDVTAESILSFAKDYDLPNGNYNVTIDGSIDGKTIETKTYLVELINYYDDVIYTLEDADENGKVILGDETTEYKMLIVKYHGNLTIEEGVTLTVSDVMTSINSKYYDIVYKKGFFVSVGGTLTNKGTISMTARGSNAEGENVYLLKNYNGTFEYIPAIGADGAPDYKTSGDKGLVGNPGSDGTNRQTGGGGNGGIVYTTYRNSNTGNSGSSGTSYSGGAGGGGGNHGVITGATETAGGSCYGVNSGNKCQTGVGITTGTVSGYGIVQSNLGTGGLLIINADTLNNTGTIESEGISPASSTITSMTYGGASGGGSINIFTSNLEKQGTISTIGGTGLTGYSTSYRKNTSGSGGTGSATISLLNAQYEIISSTDMYDNADLYSISSDYGNFTEEFTKDDLEYELILDEYTEHFTISAETDSDSATLEGTGLYHITEGETLAINLIVTSESGEIQTYMIKAIRGTVIDPDSKLETLAIDNYTQYLDHEFHPLITEYNISIPSDVIDLEINATTFDENAEITIEGNKYITSESGVITITVSSVGTEDTVYTINYTKDDPNKFSNNFEYTGGSQTFTALNSGIYRIELWGAEGGSSSYNSYSNIGGKGAYTKGDIYLEKDETLYVYVGGQGATYNTGTLVANGQGYNGGGPAGYSSGNSSGGGGGGATDVRLVDGTWSTTTSLTSRIMVAAGGGGSRTYKSYPNYSGNGGSGGTLTGKSGESINVTCYAYGEGATQISGGKSTTCSYDGHAYTGVSMFGYGANSLTTAYYQTSSVYSGGGGGYYGGGRGYHAPAGGGSSYISGYLGSVAVTSNSSTTAKTGCENGTDDVTCSYHYSGKIFSNAVMLSGDDEVPTHDGTDVMEGNAGNGYAKITIVPVNNYLSTLTSTHGTFDKEFDPTALEYNLTIEKYDEQIKIDATALDENAVVSGTGYYNIENGTEETINISVTSETGDVKVYTINVTREEVEEDNTKLKTLAITNYENDLNLEFEPLITEYDIKIPANVVDLTIEAEAYDSDSTITIENDTYLIENTGVVTITVTNPTSESTIYKLNYTRQEVNETAYLFEYTGETEKFVIPQTGKYKIELWGAQGGSVTNYAGGKGAYTKGVISLTEGEVLYINVGGEGSTSTPAVVNSIAGGYNGGGFAYISRASCSQSNASGGGATDIRLTNGNLNSRIMVAAGGGGSYSEYCSTSDFAYIYGGDGGALEGLTPVYSTKSGYSDLNPTGGTQTSGGKGLAEWTSTSYTTSYIGSFGVGGNGYGSGASFSGGGGGYYGGASGKYQPGAGGSSYISGHLGVVSVISESSTTAKTDCSTTEGATECATHYSGKVFTETTMLAGNEEMPTYDGTNVMVGNTGNGYAKISLTSSDNYLSSLTSNRGTFTTEFNPTITKYELNLSKYDESFILSGELSNENSTVLGLGKHAVDLGEQEEINIVVTSEDGEVKTYTILVTREDFAEGEHSSKLRTLEVEGYELQPEFYPTTTEYNILINYNEIDFTISTTAFDENATIEISNTKYITNVEGTFEVTVSAPDVENTIYKINYTREETLEEKITTFEYTGDAQEFVVPLTGKYKIELWGAQGYYSSGRGAYTSGEINLTKGEVLYVYVGQGLVSTVNGTSFNGGTANSSGVPGGGATDIRLSKGTTWRDFSSLKTRIMVAAGSGSGTGNSTTDLGYGGALTGGDGTTSNGATQTAAGARQSTSYSLSGFGYANGGCSGGGGYYGGGATSCASGAGGGSSYVSGYEGVNSISESSIESNIIHTGEFIHYSGYYFENPVMIAGNEQLPTYDGISTMLGNKGNGYAKITALDSLSIDNYLLSLNTDNGIINETFDIQRDTYTLSLDKYDINFELSGELSDENATVIGLEEYTINLGETKTIQIFVTSESGDIRTYNVIATRGDFADDEHTSKLSSLAINNINVKLTPKFHPNVTEYTINVPTYQYDLNIETTTFDEEATITVTGDKYLYEETGTVTITVTEPNSEDTVYTINYTKKDVSEMLAAQYDFAYTGSYQKFIVPVTGKYKIELWGAQGGQFLRNGSLDSERTGGKGSYTSGYITLNENQELYIYVGGKGTDGKKSTAVSGGYNGGGNADYDHADDESAGAGGGATDIRYFQVATNSNNLLAEDFEGLKSRIMVAAGGGGSSDSASGTAGGGLESNPTTHALGATQTSGYAFGIGKDGVYKYSNKDEAGGGGGYYGGLSLSSSADYYGNASGGSSFISGHDGSDAIGADSTENNIVHTSQSVHYSGLEFTETTMIDGDGYSWTNEKGTEVVGQPTTDGLSTQTGNTGNGYAKITPIVLSEDNYLKSLTTNYGTFDNEFNPINTEYKLTIDKYEQHFTLSGELSDNKSVVTGLGLYELSLGETKEIEITVTSESGDMRTYTVTAYRPDLDEGEHTSKLTMLETVKYGSTFEPRFQPNIYEYNIDIALNEISLEFNYEAFDEEATIVVKNNLYIKDDTGTILIIVSEPNSEDTVYKINYTKDPTMGETKIYEYNGTYTTFTAPITGFYKIELWGAEGGSGRRNWSTFISGGKGGYTSGTIVLSRSQNLYIYVGGSGKSGGTESTYAGGSGGYNGGGKGGDDSNHDSAPDPSGGGGGATDVRTVVSDDGLYDNFDSLKSRIMVAAGGGGGNYGSQGTSGGRSTIDSYIYKFGIGGSGVAGNTGSGGGGGGYYGGFSVNGGAGYGGTSYISGHDGSNSVSESSTEDNITLTGESTHYSGLSFTDTVMIDGDGYSWTDEKSTDVVGQPTIDGESTQTGNTGNGYAKITPLFPSYDNFLAKITTDKGTISPEFDPLVNDYYITLGVDDTRITINARPSNDTATVEGLGEHMVPAGTTTYPIMVTSESGDIRTYNVIVTREASSESRAQNIEITGLVPSICNAYEGYCELDTEYNEDKDVYYMTVPSGIRELEFTVDKKHEYQSVVGEGVTRLAGGDNVITIEITSEDGQNVGIYTYEIYRDMTGNNYIDQLEIINPSIDIGFDYLLTEYAFKVDNEVTSLEMNIVLDDENATYEVIGNENFAVGSNVVEIEVTAANGEVRNYILNVYRVSNSNTLLSSLEVTNEDITYALSPDFEDIKTNYTLNVENEVTTVTISATAQADTTVITGTGEVTLETGLNQFKVVTTAEDGTIETYTIIITRAKSSNNYLSSLSIAESVFNETFDKNVNSYTTTVDPYTKSVTISLTLEDETASYTISGNSKFKIGENLVTITVTAENGEVRNYYIVVTKEGSDINYLSSLSINQGELTPEFNKETLEYTVNVENIVTSITISGEKEDSLSTVKGFGTYKLVTGNNVIKVSVTSETGNLRQYIINVYREYSSDSSLKSITLSNGELTPNFSSDITEYTVSVESQVENIKVTGLANVNTTTVSGNGTYSLVTGENTVTLIATAEDTSTTTYTITIVRDTSSNANLGYLLVKEGIISPEFDPMKLTYTAVVPNDVTELNVIAEAQDEKAMVTVTGTQNLVVGENIVNVTVTAEDVSIKTYEITVTRQEETENNLDLKTLDVTSCTLSPSFDGNVQYYECEVAYEVESVTVTAALENESNVLTGTGTYNLEVGRNLIPLKVTDSNLYEKDYQVVVTRLKSTESRLKNIIVENHVLNENFDPDTYIYTLTTKEKYLNISYELMQENETVEIIGNDGLILGENTIELKVTGHDEKHESIYKLVVTKELSDNNYLKELTVEDNEISPTFEKGITDYTLTVENEITNIIVDALPEYEDSIVTGTGMYTLEEGENTVEIKVTSETGQERIYTLTVTRLGSRNNNLSSLEVVGYEMSPSFDPNVVTYSLTVEYEIENVEIKAEVQEENASVTGDGIIKLEQGLNKINVLVTSENGDIKTYVINITRKDPITSRLKNIEVKGYVIDPVFQSKKTTYNVVVDNEVTSLDLIITKLDPKSTYVIEGNSDFEVGLNTVTITSTSSDKAETTTYKINVNRQVYSNTYLKTLSVSEGSLSPSFDKTILSYDVVVENEIDSIIVEATPESELNTVEGTGEHTLEVGENLIQVKVVNVNGVTRAYNINVTRIGSNNANISKLTTKEGALTKLGNTSYSLSIPNNITVLTKDNFTVELEDSNATYEMETVLNLEESNEYVIKVTSADKSVTKEYIIYVEYTLSTDATLKSLSANTGTLVPAFSSNTTEYTLNVLDTVTEVELIAEVNNENSTILNESLIYELDNYTTVAQISVQAEDGSIKIYTVNIEKSITTEKYLENIQITKVKEVCTNCKLPEYSQTTYEYSLSVPYEVSEIGFEITKKHQNQKVTIYKNAAEVEDYTLSVGENTFVIEVENSIGNKVQYIYKVERLKSDNNYLSSLKMISPEYIFEDFDKETQEYSVQIPYEYENVEIEAIAEDTENATVVINGATYLSEGNNDVSVKVFAASGDIRTYIIHVLRTPQSNNLLKTLTVSSGDIYTLTPKFTGGITDYTLTVPSTINKITVEGLPDVETTTVEGNGEYDLKTGLNEIVLTTTSIDGVSREYKIVITRQSSKNVYLSTLQINNGTISPEFTKETGLYEVSISHTEDMLDMIALPEDENATVEIIGNENLMYGENTVKIKVISSDKTAAKTYVLKVNKEGDINNNLKDLQIDGETIEGFDPSITDYEIEVENIKTSVVVNAQAESEYASISGIGLYSLIEGENLINVVVQAQNGNVKIYTIKVIRKANTYLSAIVTDEGSLNPTFEKTIQEYTVEVENDIKEITIIGLKDDVNATVEGNGKYTLSVGENNIVLKVTNGEYTREYKVTVIRKGSTNTYLEYLTVAEAVLDPIFDKETMQYTVYIPDDKTQITIDCAPEDETSEVEIIGNENFTEEEQEVTIRVTSTSGDVRDYNIKVIRQDASLFSNKLLSLSVNKGTMSPKFDPDISEYTVTVTNSTSEITVSAVRESTESTVIGTGTHQLVVGRNVIQVLVISKDNKQRIYTLIVYRRESSDARLSELSFNEGYLSPVFNKNVYSYTLITESDTKYITTKTVKPVEENATYEISMSTDEVKTGDVININVTSPDKTVVKTYKITVKVEKSSNAYLKELSTSIGEITPELTKGTFTYKVDVGNEVNSIVVSAKAESDRATVQGTGLYELETGENIVNITVTAENGTSNIYSVIINKAKSSNNNLKELYIRGYSFDKTFDKDTLEYSLEVENDVEELTIEGQAEDARATVIGLGTTKLEVGENKVNVTVTAEDGSIKTYTIIITRQEIKSSKIRNLEILEGELTPEFVSENYEYYVSIPNEYTSITPIIELEEENATYEIIGNKDFIVGENEVQIKVTSTSGEVSTYKINVIRNVSSNNYIKIIEVNKGELTPAFDKDTLNYEVELPNTEDTITVSALPESPTTTIRGIGTYDLEVGENSITLYSRSESGVERTYKITVTRQAKDNNYLSNIIVSEGSLSPEFDKEVLSYEVAVEEGLEEIEIYGIKEDETATITGEGKYEIKTGKNVLKLMVTSEAGEVRIYEVKVTRPIGTSTNIINIIPSTGTLTPEYSNDVTEYTVNVDKNTNIMNFDVELESKTAKVEGNENIVVNGKETKVTIIVTAEDGTTKEVTITIIKESTVEKIELEKTNIILPKEETYQISTKVYPEDITNVTYEYISEDENIVSVDENGKITAKKVGNTIVTVKVAGEDVEAWMTVTVVENEIKSNVYSVKDKDEAKIIIGADEGDTLGEFVENLLNEESMIKIYDKDGNKIEDMNQMVQTGLVVKLEINEKVYDNAIIIVRGDINEDGLVDVSDKVKLLNHILLKEEITDYRIYACDVEEDDLVDVSDKVKLVNYILRKISTLN